MAAYSVVSRAAYKSYMVEYCRTPSSSQEDWLHSIDLVEGHAVSQIISHNGDMVESLDRRARLPDLKLYSASSSLTIFFSPPAASANSCTLQLRSLRQNKNAASSTV